MNSATVDAMTESPTFSRGVKAGTLTIACLAMLLLAIDMTVLHLAIPKLVTDLAPGATQLLWILDIYGFALAGLLITMGNVGDRIGRKRLLLIGATGFGLASLVTAYAPNPDLLIAARALLGVTGATLMPSTLALIRNVFTNPKERTSAIGLWSSVAALGFGGGPLVGGFLLNHFWWGSVFLVNVPVTAAIVVAGLWILPESRNPNPGRIDVLSVGLSFTGMIAIVYAVKEVVEGALRAEVLVPGVIGLVAMTTFVLRQGRIAYPLIDIDLFKRRSFTATISATLVATFCMTSTSWIFAQYFQLVLGWSPLLAGVAGLPAGVAAAVAGVFAAQFISGLGRAGSTSLGLGVAAVGFVLYGQVTADTPYWYLLSAMIVTGVGTSLTFAVANDTVVGSVPKSRSGAASALSETATELGSALGIAVLGSVLAAGYRAYVTAPDGLPAAAAESVDEGLGPALAISEQLPEPLGGAVADAAKSAFLSGLTVTTLTAGALLFVLAGAVLYTMRGIPKQLDETDEVPAGDSHEQPERV